MDRRNFLASGAVLGATALAGCSGFGEPTALSRSEGVVDADGQQKHFTYRHNDRKQAIFSLRQGYEQEGKLGRFPLQYHVWHREGLSIDRIRVRMRAPPTSVSPPAEIYLKTPSGGPWPPFDIDSKDNLWTVIEVDSIGELGEGSLGIETLVQPVGVPTPEVAVRAEIGLSTTGIGSGFLIDQSTQFDVVQADESGAS